MVFVLAMVLMNSCGFTYELPILTVVYSAHLNGPACAHEKGSIGQVT